MGLEPAMSCKVDSMPKDSLSSSKPPYETATTLNGTTPKLRPVTASSKVRVRLDSVTSTKSLPTRLMETAGNICAVIPT